VKVLLLDNFDSFTYNLFHYLEEFGCEITVARNNEISLEEIVAFDKIILSPGPGLPQDAGIMPELIARYYDSKPILGVCLGMQALGEFFGSTLYNQHEVKHGVPAFCTHTSGSRLLKGIPERFVVGLYHSWAVQLSGSEALKGISWSEEQVLMAVEHTTLPIAGVQFHPESLMTPSGKEILHNFLQMR
jgi:anthranilate synthase component 2